VAATQTLGRYVRTVATFVSTDLITPADPSTIIWRILHPESGVACYSFAGGSITRSGTGAYYKDITPDVYGDWAYNALGTGGVQAVDEWHFEVKHSRFVL
jgi:hypothetical protein